MLGGNLAEDYFTLQLSIYVCIVAQVMKSEHDYSVSLYPASPQMPGRRRMQSQQAVPLGKPISNINLGQECCHIVANLMQDH